MREDANVLFHSMGKSDAASATGPVITPKVPKIRCNQCQLTKVRIVIDEGRRVLLQKSRSRRRFIKIDGQHQSRATRGLVLSDNWCKALIVCFIASARRDGRA